jgi:hypothetical protein
MICSHVRLTQAARASVATVALLISVQLPAQAGQPASGDASPPSQTSVGSAGSETWTYIKPSVNLTKYRTVIVDSPMVYQGADAQFDGIDPAEREKYAGIMNDALRTELAKSFPTPATPGANTLRVQLTLIGAQKTVGGVATATRILPIGLAMNVLKSATDRQGTLTGSVVYGVELRDARTGEILMSAIRRGTPDPLDVEATLSTTDTVKSVARAFAERSRKRLLELTGLPPASGQ